MYLNDTLAGDRKNLITGMTLDPMTTGESPHRRQRQPTLAQMETRERLAIPARRDADRRMNMPANHQRRAT